MSFEDGIEAPAVLAPPPLIRRGKRLTREFSIVVAGQLGVAFVSLAGLRLLTTLLVPAEFGRVALGISIATLFQQVVFGPIAVATLRYAGTAYDDSDLQGFLRSVDRLLAQGVAVSVAAAAVAGLVVLALGLYHWLTLGVFCVWFASASGVFTTQLSIDASLRNRGWVAALQACSEAARYLVAGVFVVLLGAHNAVVVMAGFAAALTLAALIQIARTRRSPVATPTSPQEWRPVLLRFAKPLALTGGVTWSQMTSDRWSLNAVMSTADVGVYSAVYQIAVAPFSLFGSMIQQLLGPIVFRIAGTGADRDRVRESHVQVMLAVSVLLVLSAIAVLATWQFHAAIFRLLVGPAFSQYSYMLPIGVMAGGLLAAGQVVATTVMSRGETRHLVVPKAVTSVIGLILNILGARYFGVLGVLMANVAFSLLYFVWMLIIASHRGEPAAEPVAA